VLATNPQKVARRVSEAAKVAEPMGWVPFEKKLPKYSESIPLGAGQVSSGVGGWPLRFFWLWESVRKVFHELESVFRTLHSLLGDDSCSCSRKRNHHMKRADDEAQVRRDLRL